MRKNRILLIILLAFVSASCGSAPTDQGLEPAAPLVPPSQEFANKFA